MGSAGEKLTLILKLSSKTSKGPIIPILIILKVIARFFWASHLIASPSQGRLTYHLTNIYLYYFVLRKHIIEVYCLIDCKIHEMRAEHDRQIPKEIQVPLIPRQIHSVIRPERTGNTQHKPHKDYIEGQRPCILSAWMVTFVPRDITDCFSWFSSSTNLSLSLSKSII